VLSCDQRGGFRLRDARRRAGLSLHALEARTGRSRSALRYLEQGKRRPSCAMVAALTDALSLTWQEQDALAAVAAHSPYKPSCGHPAHDAR